MAITITGIPPKKRKPAARRFTNGDIAAIAPEIMARQAAGIIIARDLAASLNDGNVPHPAGSSWNDTLLYHLLRRGRALGLPFILRSRSEAASLRRVVRRSKDVIEAERAAAWKVFQQRAAGKTAITAAMTAAIGPAA